MNTDENILDISSEISGEEFIVQEAPLLVFRVIGCTFVTVLVGFTIIVYVTSGMSHVDCMAQINAEFCILSAYMLILLTTTESSKINQDMCISISFFLHIFFVGAFFFSLLEVLCISQVLVPFFQKRLFLRTIHICLIGWACPIAIACITSLIWMKEFLAKSNCWVDMNKPMIWPTIIPIGVCIGLQLILLFILFFTTDVPISVPQSQFNRAKSFLGTRWASTIILIILTAAWSCGVLAYNRKQETLYAAFTVANILLGVCIFTLRISTDNEIRSIIVSDLLCCLVPKNKVTAVSIKPLQSKNSKNKNGLMPNKIIENDDGGVTSHR